MMNGMIQGAIRVGYHPKIDQTIKKIQAKRTDAAAAATASRVGEDPNENDEEADWFLADVSLIDDGEGAVDHNNVPPKEQNDDDDRQAGLSERQDGNYCQREDQGHPVEDDDIMFKLDL